MKIRKVSCGNFKLKDCNLKIDSDNRYTIININDKFNFFFDKNGEYQGIGENKKINRKDEIL